MKTLIALFATIFSLFSFSAIAQDEDVVKFDINGLLVYSDNNTKAGIIARFGEPIKYTPPSSNTEFFEYYEYANSYFHFNKGGLEYFVVEDLKFKFFDGRVAVGYPLCVVENLPGCRFVLRNENVYEGIAYSELWIGYDETFVSIGHKNGIITSISYSVPS